MKKSQRKAELKRVAMIHESLNDGSEAVEGFRTLFVILFVFAIYVV